MSSPRPTVPRPTVSALDKLDLVLLGLEKKTKYVGDIIKVNQQDEYTDFHCINPAELVAILKLLETEELIFAQDRQNPQSKLHLTTKGYQRLRDIGTPKDSRQCFVAMWMAPEIDSVYEKAIRPGIEFVEEGENEPRFRALRIDKKEHINDITDEIVGEIRRSRFMVADLTGYRGGVYWEAGFAFGLGLDVIYTCRKDWAKGEILKDEVGKEVPALLDKTGRLVEVGKNSVHFDLEHRNRIEWTEDDLSGFRDCLLKRIKAVII